MNNTGLLSRLIWGMSWRIRAIYQAKIPFLLPQWDEDEFSALNNSTGIDRKAVEAVFRERLSIPAAEHVVFTSSGRTALRNALRNAKQRMPDRTEVAIPSFSCLGVLQPVLDNGLTPVFYDIGENLVPDPIDALRCVNEGTLAVVAVHLMGARMETEMLSDRCREYGSFLISDECQATGIDVPSHFDYRIFSFTEGKTLTAGGGALVSKQQLDFSYQPEDQMLASKRLATIGDAIKTNRASNVTFDYENNQMADVSMAVLGSQLGKLSWILQKRLENAEKLDSLFLNTGIVASKAHVHNHTKYCVIFSTAEQMHRFVAFCAAEGICLESLYRPLHQRPEGKQWATRPLPRIESLWERVTTIPIRPNLSFDENRRIRDTINLFTARHDDHST